MSRPNDSTVGEMFRFQLLICYCSLEVVRGSPGCTCPRIYREKMPARYSVAKRICGCPSPDCMFRILQFCFLCEGDEKNLSF